jgi:hypothetical protein
MKHRNDCGMQTHRQWILEAVITRGVCAPTTFKCDCDKTGPRENSHRPSVTGGISHGDTVVIAQQAIVARYTSVDYTSVDHTSVDHTSVDHTSVDYTTYEQAARTGMMHNTKTCLSLRSLIAIRNEASSREEPNVLSSFPSNVPPPSRGVVTTLSGLVLATQRLHRQAGSGTETPSSHLRCVISERSIRSGPRTWELGRVTALMSYPDDAGQAVPP